MRFYKKRKDLGLDLNSSSLSLGLTLRLVQDTHMAYIYRGRSFLIAPQFLVNELLTIVSMHFSKSLILTNLLSLMYEHVNAFFTPRSSVRFNLSYFNVSKVGGLNYRYLDVSLLYLVKLYVSSCMFMIQHIKIVRFFNQLMF